MKKVELISTSKLTRNFYLFLILMLSSLGSYAQNMGVNATGAPPNTNAGLDVDFTDKGILIPRVALTGTANFAPLAAHVAGMIVYNTATVGDVSPGFYYNNGARWVASIPSGNALGDMLYWNGSDWVRVPAGIPGQFLQFTSSSIPTWTGAAFASITTVAPTIITGTTANPGGNITSDGGSPILSRGVCYSTNPNPTIANSIVVASPATGIGAFTCNLTGLSPVTTYFVRAYATNSSVTTYGNEISFSTSPVIPILAATFAASAITGSSAHTGGNVTSTGGVPILERGVCYGLSPNPTTANSKVIDPAPGPGAFGSDITGLNGNTTYYVRAYAINSVGTGYGTQISFVTLQTMPVITTAPPTNITAGTVTSGGSYIPGSGGNLWNYGIAYATTPNSATPTRVQTGTIPVPNPWTSNLTGLTANTTYYIRAYIQGSWNGVNGVYDYGNELSFTTSAPTVPVMATTTAVTNITYSTASSGGSITSDGGSAILVKGVCWDTSPNPVLGAANFTSNGSGTGAFGSSITGLSGSTIYYVRSYATNAIGTGYGPDQTFTTCVTPAYNIGDQVGGGTVFYVDCAGGGLISSMADQSAGVVWGCSGTAMNTPSTLGTGSANTTTILNGCATRPIAASVARDYNGGGFSDWYLPSSAELGLMMNQHAMLNLGGQYWTSSDNNSPTAAIIWYYITNVQQTSAVKTMQMRVRAIRSFAPATLPVVTTDAATNIGNTTATSGGNVTSDGGATVTARGVCWSTSPNPTIADPKTTNGTGTGAFVSNITGLTIGTLYYVRSYATNVVGTAYGSQVNFTTTAYTLATLTTDAITNIAATTATSGGNITADGGSPVTQRGVCWSTVTGPTTADFLTSDGTGSGTFVSNLTGLTNGTFYYVRAYAITLAGTAYGNEQTFTATGPGVPTVTTDAPTNGTSTTVTSGGNVTIDGGASVTARGVAWSNVNFPPTIADLHTTDGSGTGTFTSSITGLTPGVPYSIVAYATNSYGTGYGAETFYTPLGVPIVLTYSLIYTAPETTGSSGVMVTSDGGDPLTAMGIVWDDAPNPTITTNLGITSEFLGIGYYQLSTITGIVQNTTYYVRAYATNGVGTAYGAEFSFTPGVLAIPTVTTDAIVNLFGAQAECGATVYSDGGDPLIVAGLCWDVSTNADPTVGTNLGSTIDGFTGNFYSIITGLTVGTSYKVRAYATNNTGTGYGAVLTFTATAAYVGQILQNGWLNAMVFNIDATGTHGMIAEINPWITTDWGCTSTVTGATGTAIGTGMLNTTTISADIIANACTSAYYMDPWWFDFAAPMSQWNGLDWYLPSKDELNEMFLTSATTGLNLSLYSIWSSSEVNATHAWYFDGTTSTWHNDGLKTAGNLVWPIRLF
jgi:hypothetical protein